MGERRVDRTGTAVAYRRASNGRPLSGWCTACGAFLFRFSTQDPMLNSDGTPHSHASPWDLGPKPSGDNDDG